MCDDTYHEFFNNFLEYLTEFLNDSDSDEDTYVQVTQANITQHFPKSFNYQDLMKAPILHHYMDKESRVDLWQISKRKAKASKRKGCKLINYWHHI